MIDTSGSMDEDIAEVKNRIGDFNTAMTSGGIDANYGLVTFGGNSGNTSTSGTAAVEIGISDFSTFTGTTEWGNLTASGGGNERGSLATSTALGGLTFRSGAVKNMILVTDEDDDSSVAQFNTADSDLTSASALFNFIGVPGVGNTDSRYGVLASNHGGQAFSITSFRADPEPFFTAFTNTKVEEIQREAGKIPEPATLGMFGIGLAGLGFVAARRRKIA